MHIHFLDRFSVATLFVLTFLLMVFMLELGFRFGLHKKRKSVKAQVAQVRALMGATLGLLAFMLAFTFSAAQDHFESRIQLQVDEAISAKNAFMQADLSAEPARMQARQLLQEYVEGRVKLLAMVRDKNQEEVYRLLERANEIQMHLWSLGKQGRANGVVAFTDSVLRLMDMQTRRVHAALSNRIPLVIWLTLYFTAFMSMVVVGYQAGLTERRSPIATFSLAMAFSAVMMLIMDLDRPLQSLFAVDVAVMQQLAEFMRSLQ
jgi:hypothetical protein